MKMNPPHVQTYIICCSSRAQLEIKVLIKPHQHTSVCVCVCGEKRSSSEQTPSGPLEDNSSHDTPLNDMRRTVLVLRSLRMTLLFVLLLADWGLLNLREINLEATLKYFASYQHKDILFKPKGFGKNAGKHCKWWHHCSQPVLDTSSSTFFSAEHNWNSKIFAIYWKWVPSVPEHSR